MRGGTGDRDLQPAVGDGPAKPPSATRKRLNTLRQRLEGSAAQDFARQLSTLDFGNQAFLLGAGLLSSLIPLLVLVSAFASERVDDDLALRLGLDHRASDIVAHLFSSAPASFNVGTITALLFVGAGTLAVASSLQQIYEKTFHQDPRGMRNLPRLLIWIAVLCGVLAFESVVGRPARNAPGGRVWAELVIVAIFIPFFWWTMHCLLAGRVRWRRLLPSAVATGLFYVGLGIFSEFYFSSTIISDSRTYGSIGAVLGLMTWLIAVGVVIILGAVAGAVWQDRRSRPRSRSDGESVRTVAVTSGPGTDGHEPLAEPARESSV